MYDVAVCSKRAELNRLHAQDIENRAFGFFEDGHTHCGAGEGDVEEVEAVFVGCTLLAVAGERVGCIEIFSPLHSVKDVCDAKIVSIIEHQGCGIGASTSQAVEKNHMVELQTLGAVDGHDLRPMDGVGGYGNTRERELFEKGGNIVKTCGKFEQFEQIGIVIKITKIPHKPVDHLQGRHESSVASDLCVRKGDADAFEHGFGIDGCPSVEIVHHGDNGSDFWLSAQRAGCFEAGGNLSVEQGLLEGLAVFVGVHQKGHIVPVDSMRMEPLRCGTGESESVFLIREFLDMDVACLFAPISSTESMGPLRGIIQNTLFKPAVDLLDDVAGGAVIGVHGLDGDAVGGGYSVEELLDPTPKAIKRLFGVTHIEKSTEISLTFSGEDFIDQRLKQEKLKRRGVLKLIEKNMLEPSVDLESEEVVADALVQQAVREICQVIKAKHAA